MATSGQQDLMAMNEVQALVWAMLDRPRSYEWTIQGLGMLRTYLTPAVRLHVWSTRHVVQDVTTLHDHPWHFRSTVVCGAIVNAEYRVNDEHGIPHYVQRLRCGVGGGPVNEPTSIVGLEQALIRRYTPGERYTQRADQIHESHPEDGTITIIARTFLPDTEHARVLWPVVGRRWVSAEPRPATAVEVDDILAAARDRMKKTVSL